MPQTIALLVVVVLLFEILSMVARKTLAVDPTIKLVRLSPGKYPLYPPGPNCSSTYISEFLATANPNPDAISIHPYTAYDPGRNQPDAHYYDNGDCNGLKGILDGYDLAQLQAGAIHIWITEFGLNTEDGRDVRGSGATITWLDTFPLAARASERPL